MSLAEHFQQSTEGHYALFTRGKLHIYSLAAQINVAWSLAQMGSIYSNTRSCQNKVTRCTWGWPHAALCTLLVPIPSLKLWTYSQPQRRAGWYEAGFWPHLFIAVPPTQAVDILGHRLANVLLSHTSSESWSHIYKKKLHRTSGDASSGLQNAIWSCKCCCCFFLLDVFMQKLQFNFTKGSSKCLRTFVESKVKFNFLEM